MKNIYTYNGVEYGSIEALSEATGINKKTLTARLRRGMPIEKACQNIDMRYSYHEDPSDKKEKSIQQICKDHSKDAALVQNRLRYGYSLNDALNKPKLIRRQGCPIVVNGILYNSIAEALRKLDLVEKEQIVRRRLKEGMKPDKAFKF